MRILFGRSYVNRRVMLKSALFFPAPRGLFARIVYNKVARLTTFSFVMSEGEKRRALCFSFPFSTSVSAGSKRRKTLGCIEDLCGTHERARSPRRCSRYANQVGVVSFGGGEKCTRTRCRTAHVSR